MAVSSEFYRDLSKVEKKIFKISLRKAKAYALLALAVVPLTIEFIFLPDLIFYLVFFPTGALFGTYPTLLLLDQWRERKRKVELYFSYEERIYQSGQIRRYEKNEFNPGKSVKETDKI
ncbi:MAG: PrgI family protein [Lactococcus lactis]